VIAFGRIRRVTDEGQMLAALRKLGNKYFPTAKQTEDDIARNFARVAVLELTVEHLTGKHVREK
jgi:nitroimidazol reductase NimA-like FMN-containing flavoprotein (pyridoxamine 5'-phosphate oxidase superfamily)